MRRLAIFALSLCLIPALVPAQKSNSGKDLEAARIEIPVKSDKESYRVIECGRQGAMIFFKSVEASDALVRLQESPPFVYCQTLFDSTLLTLCILKYT